MSEQNEGLVEHVALSQMGETFAERKAAREALEKKSRKQVKSEDTEDKAVASKKTSRKS